MTGDWCKRWNGPRKNTSARSSNKILRGNETIHRSSELQPSPYKLPQQKDNRSADRVRQLDLSQFMGLPHSILAEICRLLHPKDLLSLARSSFRTRGFFMSKRSKPCWDASRSAIGMPEWPGVAAPHVVSLVFDNLCQEQGCSNLSSMRSFRVCRSFCGRCASVKLYSLEEISFMWPDLPFRLVKKLPWTPQRIAPPKKSLENGKFCYIADILSLERRCKPFGRIRGHDLRALLAELKSRQVEMDKCSSALWRWDDSYKASRYHDVRGTFDYLARGMKRRWGYDINQYTEVPLFRSLLESLQLLERPYHEKTWAMIEVQMKQVIREREMANPQSRQKAVPVTGNQ